MLGMDSDDSSCSDDGDSRNLQPECYAYLRSLKPSTEQSTEYGESSSSCEPGPSGIFTGRQYMRKKRGFVGTESDSDEDEIVSAMKYICLEFDGCPETVERESQQESDDEVNELNLRSGFRPRDGTQNQAPLRADLLLSENVRIIELAPPPNIPPPLQRWRPLEGVMSTRSIQTFRIGEEMKAALINVLGITRSSYLQERAIPVLMSERDAFIFARSGTGRTVAYAVPIVHQLAQIRPRVCPQDGIRALIIVPNRENVVHALDLFMNLARPTPWITVGQIGVGGQYKKNKKFLSDNVTILVTTPKRLALLLRSTSRSCLRNISHLVVECFDEICVNEEYGSIEELLTNLRTGALHPSSDPEIRVRYGLGIPTRQTVLITGSITDKTVQFAGVHMTEPVFIKDFFGINPALCAALTTLNDLPTFPQPSPNAPTPKQYYMTVPEGMRLVTLISFFLWKRRVTPRSKIIVYVATQTMVNFYSDCVRTAYGVRHRSDDADDSDDESPYGFNIFRVSTYKSERSNSEVLEKFKRSSFGILFCKDHVLADVKVPRADWIIHFSPPCTTTDYRTAVLPTDPECIPESSLLFLLPSENDFVHLLRDRGVLISSLRMRKCLTHIWSSQHSSGTVGEIIYNIQMRMSELVHRSSAMYDRACIAFASWCRSYKRYPHFMTNMFHIKNVRLDKYAKCFGLYQRPRRILSYARHLNEDRRREGDHRRAYKRRTAIYEDAKARFKQHRRASVKARMVAWYEAIVPDMPPREDFFNRELYQDLLDDDVYDIPSSPELETEDLLLVGDDWDPIDDEIYRCQFLYHSRNYDDEDSQNHLQPFHGGVFDIDDDEDENEVEDGDEDDDEDEDYPQDDDDDDDDDDDYSQDDEEYYQRRDDGNQDDEDEDDQDQNQNEDDQNYNDGNNDQGGNRGPEQRPRRYIAQIPPQFGQRNDTCAVQVANGTLYVQLPPWAVRSAQEPLPDLTSPRAEEPDSTTDSPSDVPDLLAVAAQEGVLSVLPPMIEALSEDSIMSSDNSSLESQIQPSRESSPEPQPGPSREPLPDEPLGEFLRKMRSRAQRKRGLKKDGQAPGEPRPKRQH